MTRWRAAATLVSAPPPPGEIVFGPSTTVLIGNLVQAMRRQSAPGDEVIVTMADYESNIGPWTRLEEFGVTIKVWPLNANPMDLQLADLDPLMTDRMRLVWVTHVSNILGKFARSSVSPASSIIAARASAWMRWPMRRTSWSTCAPEMPITTSSALIRPTARMAC